ncbi:CPBP family intramembrane glutamic endopeptidase [Dyadobacter sp. CY312]|uniref:CPBP family intramembrane glutamic endopeptidase n=1 Tax=Dyadobacter sp. CY312 TaxID=2907303 RepID=UPI001F322B0A|nr:CPBP family intramembrane glutamic endopeptidase [Dyadobacter sp. CY312]MCE7040087.1 CPBP family intramembrane metalloprotease [Dyadobacter sp. CY312]
MQKSSSVLLLLGTLLISMALGIGISLLIAHFFELTPLVNDINQQFPPKEVEHWYLSMLVQGLGHAFTFLIPAIVFWRIFENKTRKGFSRLQLSRVSSAWITIVVAFALISVNHQIIDWNQNIQLPDAFKAVEDWMRAKEQEKISLTQGLLQMESRSKLLVAMLVFGIIGPVGEEVFFRGVLQTKLNDWGLTPVKSIWVAATVFSLIHFQFYGFFPRLLLGALFGYLFLWSGNIWMPILAHVINNSFFVLTAFTKQKWPSSYKNLEVITDSSMSFIISFALSVILLYHFRKQNLSQAKHSGTTD